MRRLLSTVALLIAAAGPAAAQGLVIPDEPDLPPLALARHAVRVDIADQGASTTVEQVFANNTDRRLEAQYVFPLSKGAVVSKFSMIVDGKEMAGEVVAKDAARQIYTKLVSRAQEPALLEYMGGEAFRASLSVAPRARQAVTLRFEQVLAAANSLVCYTYPVRQGARRGPTVQGEFTLDAAIRSQAPIRNVYSPSHAVTVSRPDENQARVSFADAKTTLEKDFQLYYGVSDKEVGLSLLCHRPNPGEPGYFMMLLAPKVRLPADRVVERDVVFVIDTSGSMAGVKFKQAANALRYCVSRLNDRDRFNIVRFSSGVEPWKKDLVPAAEHRASALTWIDTLMAEGGTDIYGALEAAASFPRDPARPYFVVFMTDGKPTLGRTTDPAKILARADALADSSGGGSVRLFTWGVGYDVDTHLLDGMADAAGGASEYVHPEEDIEAKVSAFYNKVSRPVLTDLDVQVEGGKIQLVNIYPKRMPDLYAGSQVVLFGRYTGEGAAALTLTGRVNQERRTFTFEGTFTGGEKKNAFIEPLWAQRRVGHLLDLIRRHGESQELVDDVVRLSMEYGIQTPYASYLVRPDGGRLAMGGRGPSGGAAPVTADFRAARMTAAPGGAAAPSDSTRVPAAAPAAPYAAAQSASPAIQTGPGTGDKDFEALDRLALRARPRAVFTAEPEKSGAAPTGAGGGERHNEKADEARSLAEGFRRRDGKAAVDAAGYLRSLKEAERVGEKLAVASCKKAGGTRFFEYRGMWVDERFAADAAVTMVKFGSAAYFRLIELHPELIEALKIGESLVYVTAPGKALAVVPAGEEALTDAQIAALFAR